ncbi:alpha/beta hydrolase [Microbacterium sp. CFBP9034]|uniref:alpha/beta hydrolase n=1 Tax=Microbacterium sp. CFBP9034 TaxID=3096540 RepID=UPI002A6A5F7E|nr:alpha/beta hydrolase [Microbacterium sp. CFBP9034]MDY0910390.1 alpha/beta hydrolase [Microbacterium sp. CFBP9034]
MPHHHTLPRRLSTALVATTVAAVLALSGCTGQPQPQPTNAGGLTESNLTYREVDGEKLGMDACLPADGDGAAPAVILLHGGGFVEGNRSSSGMDDLCVWFAEHGYAAFPTSYRLVPDYTYPSQVEDVAAAVQYLRDPAQVEELGIDPARIGVLGSSAGAIIALQAAMAGEGALDQGSRLGAVVSLSGVADMSEDAVDLGEPSPEAVSLMLAYLGCRAITSCEGEAASPLTQTDPTDPPALLVASQHDLVPVEQAEVLDSALTAEGVPHELIVLLGSGHGSQLLTEKVRGSILTFLSDHL